MGMINIEGYDVIKFKDLYDVDTVMPSNDECWKEMDSSLDVNASVVIDCRGINISKPWRNEEFKKFIRRHSNVVFRIYNDDKLCDSINVMCSLAGLSERALSEKLWVSEKKIDPSIIEFNNDVKEVTGLINYEGKIGVLPVSAYVGSVGSRETLKVIKEAVRKFIEDNNPEEFTIDAGSLSITPYLIDGIIAMIAELNCGNTNVKFSSVDKELCETIEMKKTFRKVSDVNDEERYKVFSSLGKDFPCMLIRYKDSRGRDEFGRLGRGEIISCRAAIIRNVTTNKVSVDTYDGDKFLSYEHWVIENDGYAPDNLDSIHVDINLSDVGFGDKFLGEKYHIIRAVQDNPEDMYTIYEADGKGNAVCRDVCIPERMKVVFDSWDIKYNKDEIDRCIEESINNISKGL